MTHLTLDGFALRFPRTGIVNYIFNITKILNSQPSFDVTVLLADLDFHDTEIAHYVRNFVQAQIVQKHVPPGRINALRESLRNRKLAVRLPTGEEIARVVGPASIYHATDWYHYPSPYARLNILTYFDLTTKLYPQYHERTNIVKEKRKAAAARDFDYIVAISHSTKKDLINEFGVDENKIIVSHLGVDQVYETPKLIGREELLGRYNIDHTRRYILGVSTIEPRKNIIGILNAYKILCDDSPHLRDVLLVLSGAMGWHNEDLNKFLHNFKYRDNVIFTGYVDLSDMPSLYRYAEAFVYLPFYEGFGIPVLEAMKSLCPVVCSNASSIPEVIGNSGELVNPKIPNEAAEALRRILDDSIYADKLRFAAFARSKTFSWDKHVDDLIRIYESS